jgi:hypothetical protein
MPLKLCPAAGGIKRICNDVDFQFGQPIEHLQGTGEVELCEIEEYHEANVEHVTPAPELELPIMRYA